jgi:small nuclear ribonucleoprotein
VEIEEMLRRRLHEVKLRSNSITSSKLRYVKPLRLLHSFIGNTVFVKTRGGFEFTGVLEQVDFQMNLILAECIELEGDKPVAKYHRALLRGSNIEYVSLNNKNRSLLDFTRQF